MRENLRMKQALRLLTFLAFITQVWIPAGFMPDAHARTMTICSGMEQKTITLDGDGQPVQDHADKRTCAYAVTTMAAATAPEQPALPVPAFSVPEIARVDAVAAPRPLYRPHATAPPVLL